MEEIANLFHVVEGHAPCDGFTKCPQPGCAEAKHRYDAMLAARQPPGEGKP